MKLPPATVLADLGLSDSAIHTFTAALQGVVAAGVSAEVPSPTPSVPAGKVEKFPSCTSASHVGC